MKYEPVEVISVEVDSNSIMTEQQWEDSHEFSNLISFLIGESKDLQSNDRRNLELDLIPGFKRTMLRDLFNHMASGKVYETFGSRLGVTENRKRKWLKDIQEWRTAKELGETAHFERWEERFIETAETGVGNATLIVAKLKSFRKEFNDTKASDPHLSVSVSEGNPIFHFDLVLPIDDNGKPKQLKQVHE